MECQAQGDREVAPLPPTHRLRDLGQRHRREVLPRGKHVRRGRVGGNPPGHRQPRQHADREAQHGRLPAFARRAVVDDDEFDLGPRQRSYADAGGLVPERHRLVRRWVAPNPPRSDARRAPPRERR